MINRMQTSSPKGEVGKELTKVARHNLNVKSEMHGSNSPAIKNIKIKHGVIFYPFSIFEICFISNEASYFLTMISKHVLLYFSIIQINKHIDAKNKNPFKQKSSK
jgi:hypothetical protein